MSRPRASSTRSPGPRLAPPVHGELDRLVGDRAPGGGGAPGELLGLLGQVAALAAVDRGQLALAHPEVVALRGQVARPGGRDGPRARTGARAADGVELGPLVAAGAGASGIRRLGGVQVCVRIRLRVSLRARRSRRRRRPGRRGRGRRGTPPSNERGGDVTPRLDWMAVQSSSLRFVRAVQALASLLERVGSPCPGSEPSAARGASAPSSGCPGGAAVAVVVRGRPWPAVLADLVEGRAANGLQGPRGRRGPGPALWAALIDDGGVVGSRMRSWRVLLRDVAVDGVAVEGVPARTSSSWCAMRRRRRALTTGRPRCAHVARAPSARALLRRLWPARPMRYEVMGWAVLRFSDESYQHHFRGDGELAGSAAVRLKGRRTQHPLGAMALRFELGLRCRSLGLGDDHLQGGERALALEPGDAPRWLIPVRRRPCRLKCRVPISQVRCPPASDRVAPRTSR